MEKGIPEQESGKKPTALAPSNVGQGDSFTSQTEPCSPVGANRAMFSSRCGQTWGKCAALRTALPSGSRVKGSNKGPSRNQSKAKVAAGVETQVAQVL